MSITNKITSWIIWKINVRNFFHFEKLYCFSIVSIFCMLILLALKLYSLIYELLYDFIHTYYKLQ